ncbi:hypothetical protein Ancab_004330 [Ancistrocladus abbreviatus]
MESTDSSTAASQQLQLPPGFRFHPTDEELVVHYLRKKAQSAPLPVAIIADLDLYKFDPSKAAFGEQEWYFFSPRDRKYPNGARANRATRSGYWKATGTDKPVLNSSGTQKVGVKKALVFYGGKPPRGVKTNWIMHEYRLSDNKPNDKPFGCDLGNKKGSLRLDDWVLCRIYKKDNTQRPIDHDRDGSLETVPSSVAAGNPNSVLLENDHHLFDGMLVSEGINAASTSQQVASSNPNQEHLSVAPSTSMLLNRTFRSLYWHNEDGVSGVPSSSNRMLAAGSSISGENGNNSIATLLNQLPM